MGGLADALAKACTEAGVVIQREAEVSHIVVEKRKVCGVQLLDGSFLRADVVASSIDAHQTFLRLLEPRELPKPFREAIGRINYASASAKINLALSEPPEFRACPGKGIRPYHQSTIHIAPTLDYLERAYDDAKYGRPSTEPILEITLPSSLDDSLAPPNHHVMSIFVQYAPYQLSDGSWDEQRERFGDRCIEVLARYAPNVPNSIVHRQVLTPLDLERTFRLTGGNIMQGGMDPYQLFMFRPVAGWADHHTPIEGLYLCGAASHPGGGVMGAAGRNAAVEILRGNL